VPRKIDLYWFIPAFAKRRVGSACGTTEEDGTRNSLSINIDFQECGILTKLMPMIFEILDELITDTLGWPRARRVTRGAHNRPVQEVLACRGW